MIFTILVGGCGPHHQDTQSQKGPRSVTSTELQPEVVQSTDSVLHNTYPKVTIENSIVRRLHSSNNNFDYDIYIAYPPNFSTEKKYPALYVLDAEVNFGAICYIVQRLIKDGLIPETLVVGIAYPGDFNEDTYYSLRCRDLTPTIDKKFMDNHESLTAGSGGAPKFATFLEHELLPFIENNYSASHDRTLYGHSLGGLFGFYAILNHPELFGKYLLLSPSLWWDNEEIFHNTRAFKINNSPKIYVATGELENSKDVKTNRSMVDQQNEVVKILQQINGPALSLKAEILSKETHRTIFGRGVTNGLRFLCSKK